jgi:hypothetical protein
MTPHPSAPPGPCRTCRGPTRPGQARCFQCALHEEAASGWLADVVAPVAYAPKGSAHARRLWVYKSALPQAGAARRELAGELLAFLREHGPCLWRQAGWPAGPTHLAVVPSRHRTGPHPLRVLAAPYVRLPWAGLAASPGNDAAARELDPRRFTAPLLPGARVLLLDDTWTTGASVQSAALALRRGGARGVAAVVLGRHLTGPAPAVAPCPCAADLHAA